MPEGLAALGELVDHHVEGSGADAGEETISGDGPLAERMGAFCCYAPERPVNWCLQ